MRMVGGIDGGGTRTRLALVREDGTLVAYAEGPSYSFMDRGVEAARAELRELWRVAWLQAGENPRAVDALFMGTGSVLSEADADTNRDLAVDAGLVADRDAVHADNDAWNAHAGGLAGRPGILLIAGTGSACLGRTADGRTWRSGGWGYLLNDTGSGYALGHAAMIAATRDADGRGARTRLTTVVCEALEISDMKRIFRRVHHDGVSRAEVAALAPAVVELADAGDRVAEEVVAAGVAGLSEMIVTVADRLGMKQPELSLTGGLANAPSYRARLLQMLRGALPGFSIAADGMAPVFGAVLLAAQRLLGVPLPPDFVVQLRAAVARASAVL